MIKRVPIEPWSTWEKLCLANAVLKAGDQNWNAVSRTAKVIYEDSMQILGHEIRPPHWFSVKQCAAQYELLIARIVPKRKKRERNSEPADPVHRDAIFNTLKNEYVEELEKKKEEDRMEYARIMKRRDDILAGIYDDVLEEMWAEELKDKDKDIKLKLKYKLGEKNAERNASPIKTFTSPSDGGTPVVTPPPTSSTSPLLTSLLQSPSQHSLPSSPSISLLLNSTPSIPTNESPTLTKLLESPSSKVPGTVQESRPKPSDLPRHTAHISPAKPLPPIPPAPSEEKMEISEVVPERIEKTLSPTKTSESETKKVFKGLVDSEIVIEEDEEERPHKKIKLEFEQEEEEEIVESVEEILEKLKEEITEAVGGNEDSEHESEKEVKPIKVEPEELSKSPVTRTSDEEKDVTEDMDEVTTGDDTSKDIPEEAAASVSSSDAPPAKVAPTDEFNITDDEPDDSVQIDANDHEAFEIIMGSNSNSVINVLAQDSSSEDITQTCEESKEPSAPAVSDEESTPEVEAVTDIKEEKSEPEDVPDETVEDIDEDSLSKSPQKETEEEDDAEEPTATEDTSSSEAVEVENEKKDTTPPPTPTRQITQTTPLKEVCVTLEAIDVQQTCKTIGEKDGKEEGKTPLQEKAKRSRKKSATVDSKPSSPASSFNEDEKEFRTWKKSVLLVYSRIASHKYASVFSKPITDAAGYGNWILEPMDLSTIKRNIENGVIRTTIEFQRDVLLMIQNAVIYNSESSLIYSMAKEMWTDIINEMNVMVQALGDGVPLGGGAEGESAAPTRSGRQAKLSVEKKTSTTPVSTPKRQSRSRP